MKMLILVNFFLLLLALGWIFFDDNDWGKPSKR